MQALVVMDYQNIHLTAHDRWGQGSPKHETLVHPLHFGTQVVGQRNFKLKQSGRPYTAAELAQVVVYRGLPSNREDPRAYSRSMAQKSEWERDRRVAVHYRPLRYHQGNAREKGIDVLVALHLVRAARTGDFDLVVLASHDTDLEPALDEAVDQSSGCLVESAGWERCKQLRSQGNGLWHTALGEKEFRRTIDPRDYT